MNVLDPTHPNAAMRGPLFRALVVPLFLLVSSYVPAQEVDLTLPALDGLELDFLGKATANSYVTYYADLTWWNLFGMRLRGWNGGEGCYSTPLPDGRVFWSFGPSTFGRISEFRDRKKYNNTPCNAAMLQTATDEAVMTDADFLTLNEYIATDPAKETNYYRGKTWLRHPDATLSESTINRGRNDTDHRYLPGDAHVVQRDGQPVLQVVMHGVDEADHYTDLSVAEYSLLGTPGDGTYMQLIALHRDVAPPTANYGQRLLEDGQHVYLYGTVTSGNRGYTYPVVARTIGLDLCNQWEYYITDAEGVARWQSEPPTQEELERSHIVGSDRTEAPNVFRYGDHYYMLAMNAPNGQVSLWKSDTPCGPFTSKKVLYTMPATEKTTRHLFLHPQLSRMGEIVFSYTMTPEASVVITKKSDGSYLETILSTTERLNNAWGSANLNLPHFRRVYGWQRLYKVDNIGPLADAGLESYATGMDTPADTPGLRLMLSPELDIVSIEAPEDENIHWQVMNLQGQMLREGTAVGSTALTRLPKGICIVRARTANAEASAKFVIHP